ncbi:transposase zinc-binding domain-containing protein [Pyxidicoccus parkwayensis]|uniref:Transposase zinc-binding domain-containing protein n=1 Tax=Pyxidicoccus parkwayensis TaxID=2813578 RepID=A0ABX7PA43_9BACT|nr:transposase zinc-binding domain-containing protein [Pyxidicoccus parkwaysis]
MHVHGFARVRCESCKDALLVACSCKGREVCSSCHAKRVHVTAVHLVKRVLPHVPYRQWTLSFPHRGRWGVIHPVLRLGVAGDAALPLAGARRRLRATGGRRALRAAGSTPRGPDVGSLEYLATQVLVQLIADAGFDGVAYESSQAPGGSNFLFFDPDIATQEGAAEEVEVKGVSYAF